MKKLLRETADKMKPGFYVKICGVIGQILCTKDAFLVNFMEILSIFMRSFT